MSVLIAFESEPVDDDPFPQETTTKDNAKSIAILPILRTKFFTPVLLFYLKAHASHTFLKVQETLAYNWISPIIFESQ
jgi:hypothetical protein